jgi:hypothetical protein
LRAGASKAQQIDVEGEKPILGSHVVIGDDPAQRQEGCAKRTRCSRSATFCSAACIPSPPLSMMHKSSSGLNGPRAVDRRFVHQTIAVLGHG